MFWVYKGAKFDGRQNTLYRGQYEIVFQLAIWHQLKFYDSEGMKVRREITAYASSFLWNVDRWIKAWIKLHRHHRSPFTNIMHSRMCLIFKVVFVFISLSIWSWGHELQSVSGSFSVFVFSPCPMKNMTSKNNSQSPIVTSKLLSPHQLRFSSVPPVHTYMRCTTAHSMFSHWSVPGALRGFCNWACYTIMAAGFTAAPQNRG